MKAVKKYKLLLADDHVLIRDSLSCLISKFGNFCITGQVSNGRELMALVNAGSKPDIVMLDLNMPEMDGYETASWLSSQHPSIRILVLTMYDADIAIIRLLKEGVRSILKKDIHPFELKHALESIMETGYYYSGSTSLKIASLFKRTGPNGMELDNHLLSEKEIDFLRFTCSDMTYKEIAMRLHLSTRVVDNYRETLFDKLGVRSRVGLAIYAIKNGIVTI